MKKNVFFLNLFFGRSEERNHPESHIKISSLYFKINSKNDNKMISIHTISQQDYIFKVIRIWHWWFQFCFQQEKNLLLEIQLNVVRVLCQAVLSSVRSVWDKATDRADQLQFKLPLVEWLSLRTGLRNDLRQSVLRFAGCISLLRKLKIPQTVCHFSCFPVHSDFQSILVKSQSLIDLVCRIPGMGYNKQVLMCFE